MILLDPVDLLQKNLKLFKIKNFKYKNIMENFYRKVLKKKEKLPGVGHKTASVVMSQGFGVPAFPVDTHIHRLHKDGNFLMERS